MVLAVKGHVRLFVLFIHRFPRAPARGGGGVLFVSVMPAFTGRFDRCLGTIRYLGGAVPCAAFSTSPQSGGDAREPGGRVSTMRSFTRVPERGEQR